MDSSLPTSSSLVSIENRQEFLYLQNGGGLGVSLPPALASNPTLVSAIFALFLNQSSKVFLNLFKKSQLNFRLMLASHGMPSTRSALCSALTTSVALCHGVADSVFPVSLGFSLIVMCDAVAVKKHVAYHALVINTLMDVAYQGRRLVKEKIDEDVGDALHQVLTGALLGSTVAILCSLGFMLLR